MPQSARCGALPLYQCPRALELQYSERQGQERNVIEPITKMATGFLSIPLPFKCSTGPHPSKHSEIMCETFAQAEKEGLKYTTKKNFDG